MTLQPADSALIRGRLFKSWQEITAFVEEQREHQRAVLQERRAFGVIQDKYVGMEQ